MYFFIFKNILNPFFERFIKRRKMLEYRAFLEKSQWWPREKLVEYQWQELRKLLAHAYSQVPYWKSKFDEAGLTPADIKSYGDFCRLPVITKEDIRAHKDEMIAKNYRGRTWTKATGGSTGVPLNLDYTPDSYDWRVAVTKRGYAWAGCEDGMKQAFIWGTAIGRVSRAARIKERVHRALLRQKYFNCFDFDAQKMARALKSLRRFKPDFMIGYTNPLYNFARFAYHEGHGVRPRAVITAAEKLHPFQRALIEEVFACPAFDTYGSREFMLIATECEKHEGLHVSAENLWVEIIKEDGQAALPGEMGRIVISDLHNYGMPFIRYEIGDMAVATDRVCSCGRGLPLMADVAGRSLDMIRTPDGRFVAGEFFPHLMKEFKGVERFQVVQEALDGITVKIVKNDFFTEAEFAFMKQEIARVMGDKARVAFAFVDEIPLTRTGKYRVTVSCLQ